MVTTAGVPAALSRQPRLGLTEVDLLGYSLGGFVAQELTLLRQRMVRRLVLAGTGPKAGGEQMHGSISDVAAVADADNNGPEDSESSRQKGRECLQRMMARREGRDRPNGPEVGRAQYDAMVECGIPEPSKLARLAGITQPTLVANGDNDTMIPTVNSHILGRHLPSARVRIFADAGHGFLFQFPAEFAALGAKFLT